MTTAPVEPHLGRHHLTGADFLSQRQEAMNLCGYVLHAGLSSQSEFPGRGVTAARPRPAAFWPEHVGQLRAVPDVEHPATHGRRPWPKLVLSLWYATAVILLGGGIVLVTRTIGKKDASSLSWVAAGILFLWGAPWFLRAQSLSTGGGSASAGLPLAPRPPHSRRSRCTGRTGTSVLRIIQWIFSPWRGQCLGWPGRS